MVSQDSPPNPSTNIMHQFIIPNSIPDQTHFPHDPFDPYPDAPHPIPNPALFPHAPPDMIHERRLMDLLGTPNPAQRLSLSLGSGPCSQIRPFDQAHLNPGYINPGPDRITMAAADYSFPGNNNAFSTLISFSNYHHQPCSTSSNGQESFAGCSRYLKSAQSLLMEMVSVAGKDIEDSNRRYVEKLSRAGRKGFYGLRPDFKPEFSDSELCICLVKLIALLEEVERRYEEYYHHMEDLVTSFEMVAGLGSGSSYTALALQAMSKHFWTLKSAIMAQIRAVRLKIEKDGPKISSTLSGLSLLDQEGRQNRVSLQQIGLLHNSRQAWKPIRGLPDTSVTILRAWLFEHFLHPYPNDSEKLMLSTQTGLSKNQVSNWFINARVRLWKPMIEEMYKEEFADSSTESDQLPTSTEAVGDSAEDLI